MWSGRWTREARLSQFFSLFKLDKDILSIGMAIQIEKKKINIDILGISLMLQVM